jgi:hypothetical protein
MKRILLDVNFVLDVLLNRAPHADASSFDLAPVKRGHLKRWLAHMASQRFTISFVTREEWPRREIRSMIFFVCWTWREFTAK